MMAKQPLLMMALLLCCRIFATAQDDQDSAVVRIHGVLRDAATGEAIPYATVTLPLNSVSTMSNDAGLFTLIIPASARRDSIRVSHIGYRSVYVLLSAAGVAGGSDATPLIITLQVAPVQLADVTVSSVSPMTIIDKAIASIPVNYPTRPFVAVGFYRKDSHYQQKIIEISEAVFDIYSPDYDRKNLQFRLVKARADRDVNAMGGGNYVIGISPDDIMNNDMVSRIHQTQILGDEGRNDHEFSYAGLIDYEGRPSYAIDFDEKDGIQRALYKGRIIIDTATMAFLCFDYGVSPKGIAYRSTGTTPLRGQLLENRRTIRYRRYGGKYYLNQAKIIARFHLYIEDKPSVQLDTLQTSLEYMVTRIDTGAVAFSRMGKTIDNSRVIDRQIRENAGRRGDEYWKNYNLIPADFSVDSALNAIRGANEATKKRER